MRISIITVCLNSERTIEQTIQSVIRQDYADCEYIIIDGGSVDRTLEIIDRYKENISLVISEPDEGIYDAMNKGILLSTGDIIGIINSDDWYEPDVLKKVEKCFREFDAEIVCGKLNVFRESGEIEATILSSLENIRYEMSIFHPTVFIRKEIYMKYGMFQQKFKISADYELMLRLYTKGLKFVCLNEVLANFRCGGISKREKEKVEEETLKIAQKYLLYAPLPERRNLKKILTHRQKLFYFEKILNDCPYILPEVLISKFGVGIKDEIAIFGAGKWGTKMYKALIHKGFNPSFFVDNNEEKWKQNISGRKVLCPESLRTFKGVLLIMVCESSTEILLQIKSLCNPCLYYIAWDEIIDDYLLEIK